MRLRRYRRLFKSSLIELLQFRVSLAVSFLGNIIYLVIIYFLWKAIYASATSTVINGMTFQDTMIYLVLATGLHSFMEQYIVFAFGRDIQSGKIALDLVKPVRYRMYLFFSCIGTSVGNFFVIFIPTFLIVYIITGGAITLNLNLLYFLASTLLSILIYYYIEFFVATICLYTMSIWGINTMRQIIVSFFSGATIPIAFFPHAFKKVVMCLPFQAIYNAPLTLLIHHEKSTCECFEILLIQLFWVITLCICTALFWNHSIKKITVNGG